MPVSTNRENTRVIARWMARTFLGAGLMCVLLFWPAGRLHWVMGWIYVASLALVGGVTAGLVDPSLLAERMNRRHADQKSWDKVLFGVYGLLQGLVVPVTAAFDLRFNLQPEIPAWLVILAGVVYALGWALNLWAMRVNSFFAEVVRLQTDRGQVVVTGGPYRWVRHPGYLGGILLLAMTPLLLQSFWACIPGAIGAGILVVRTALEDRVLQEELQGYCQYVEQTPFRLIPGVW